MVGTLLSTSFMNGMPPHICQLLMGHKNISTTMVYKAVYPEEAINGHRAFLGHFERRKLALGDCGRAWEAAAFMSTAASLN
jgi:hypothetical protein